MYQWSLLLWTLVPDLEIVLKECRSQQITDPSPNSWEQVIGWRFSRSPGRASHINQGNPRVPSSIVRKGPQGTPHG